MTTPSGHFYEPLFAAYPDALLMVDQSGTIVLANPAATTLLGYAPAELVGLKVDALVPEAVRPKHAAYRAAYVASPRARPMGTTQTELVARHKDGREVMVEIALSPLHEQGLPFVVAAIRGIAGYPRVEQALRRARYAELLAQFGRLAVDARDPAGLIDEVPAIAVQALQVPSALVLLWEADKQKVRLVAAIGQVNHGPVGTAFVPPPGSPGLHVLIHNESVIVDDLQSETRFAVPSMLAEGFRSCVLVPISALGSPAGMLAMRSPIPGRFGQEERRFLESLANLLAVSLQRAHSEGALNHAQRMESVGQLTGGIAHDFNNLLTVIQGNLQVLEELPQLADGPAKSMVEAALRASKRAADLTGKLLAFSRRQALQAQRVDLAPLLDNLTDMLRRTLDQRIRVDVQITPDCPPVQVDPVQLEAALLNIAINSRDAMPDGGLLSFVVSPEADSVCIAVSDTGTGMSDEVRERAFEPFFTTKETGRGTGLGLSTVYGFVKQSSGTIKIDSEPSMGVTVTMLLPRWQALSAASSPAGESALAPFLRPGVKVLLVEDEPAVREVMRLFLNALGCEVQMCTDAEDALKGLENRSLKEQMPVDLLLTDIALGRGQRGTALAQQLVQRWPRLAVLLMSGYSQEMIDPERGQAWPWELLRKPCSRDELAAAMGRALQAAVRR